MKLTPNVKYNCGCKKLKNIEQEELPSITLTKPKAKTNSTQITTFYKSSKNKNKNNTLF